MKTAVKFIVTSFYKTFRFLGATARIAKEGAVDGYTEAIHDVCPLYEPASEPTVGVPVDA